MFVFDRPGATPGQASDAILYPIILQGQEDESVASAAVPLPSP